MASVGLLPASLLSQLQQIVERSNKCSAGIRVILLSTAEGVPLGRVYADTSQPLNEEVLSAIESTWYVLFTRKERILSAYYDAIY